MKNRISFVEILVFSIVLISILTAVLYLISSKILYNRQGQAKKEIVILRDAIKNFYLDTNIYPRNKEDLKFLLVKPENESLYPNWDGPYLSKAIFKDPWGREYEYKYPGKVEIAQRR